MAPPYTGFYSSDSTETVGLFDVATPVSKVTGEGGTDEIVNDLDIYHDLHRGTQYGSITVSEADNGQLLAISLNSAGLDALNAALGGKFAIGGALTSISGGDTQRVFTVSGNRPGYAPGDGRTYLDITFAPTATVPEPSTLGLFGLGLLGFVLRARRKATRE